MTNLKKKKLKNLFLKGLKKKKKKKLNHNIMV